MITSLWLIGWVAGSVWLLGKQGKMIIFALGRWVFFQRSA